MKRYSTWALGNWCSTTCIMVNLYRSVSSRLVMIMDGAEPLQKPRSTARQVRAWNEAPKVTASPLQNNRHGCRPAFA